MLKRIWHLLDHNERVAFVWLVPLVLVSAAFELLGVAAIIPFVTLLAEPQDVFELPVVGRWLASREVTDTDGLLRSSGLAVAIAIAVVNGMSMLTKVRQFRFASSLMHSVSTRLMRHYMAQPYAFVLTRNASTLTNTIAREVERLTNGVLAGLSILSSGVTIIALVGFLIVLDPLLALTSASVLGALYGIVFLASRRYLTHTSREAVRLGAARIKAVNEAFGGFRDLKMTSREESAVRHYEVPTRRYAEIRAQVLSITVLPRHALEVVAFGGVVLIASLMTGRDGAFTTTLPLLGAYVFAGLRLMPAMQIMFHSFATLRSVTGSLEALEQDLANVTESSGEAAVPVNSLTFGESVELSRVSFHYPQGDGPALRDINLVVQRGRSLAIVGRTGSGKTTLVNVLLGLLVPDGGSIAVDGVSVSAANRRAYRHLFGYVPQDVFLFDDTVRRNVAIGIPDDEIDGEAVVRACRQAQLDEFIETELPHGYETIVGERGVRLSGGQRQRLGIARALYHQPPILVFDEATSALDEHTERRVLEALDAIARERTLVMIAHRTDTVARLDRAVVVDGGCIVDEGTPQDVLRRYRLERDG